MTANFHSKDRDTKRPIKKPRINKSQTGVTTKVKNTKQGLEEVFPIEEPFVKDSQSKSTIKQKQPSVFLGFDSEAASSNRQLPDTFMVIAGSYEKLLYGLEGKFVDEDGKPSLTPTLNPIFIFPAHVSCIKAAAASPDGGKWLATGSTDEIIKIWDLRRRKETGGLIQHEGSITFLDFPSRSYLVSASEDGTICLFRSRDWVLLRTLRGHKGPVNSVAVHPSGKLALSVGKDRILRMWDLVKGKGSASTKIGKEGEIVRWSTEGDKFVVQASSTLDIYSTSMTLLHTITHPSRIHDVKFCKTVDGDAEFLLVAAEDKLVTVYAVQSDINTSLPILAKLVGHGNRVKSMDTLQVKLPATESNKRTQTTILSTISSDGKIRIFDLASIPDPTSEAVKTEILPLAEYDTKGSRLTCCTLAEGERIILNGKRKLDDVVSDEDDEDKDKIPEISDQSASGSDEEGDANEDAK